MNKIITEQLALRGLLIILSLLVVFHVLILIRVVPFEDVWGGKITSESQMQRLEGISIFISLAMLTVVSIRAKIIRFAGGRAITIILWVMFCFFCLNTIGNLLSNNPFEKLVFAPLTLILALFTYRVAKKEQQLPDTIDYLKDNKDSQWKR